MGIFGRRKRERDDRRGAGLADCIDIAGVMHCPPLHAPGIPQQGNTGMVRDVLPVEGQIVAQGALVLRIETEFAIVEVPSPVDGVIDEVLVRAGHPVSSGQPLWRYLER